MPKTTTVKDLLPELQLLGKVIERLENPKRYPAACLVETYLEKAKTLLENWPTDTPDNLLTKDEETLVDKVRQFVESPDELRAEAINRLIESEKNTHKDFFGKIESKPLTPDQCHAVIADEDATLILAGAGSGKTSVIVAKVAYLIEKCKVPPSEILVLTFNRSAAKEMSTRIRRSVGEKSRDVVVSTFHSFGREVITNVTGKGPKTAPWVGKGKFYHVRFLNHLRDILEELRSDNERIDKLIQQYFSGSYEPYKIEFIFDTWQAYEAYVNSQGEFLTLKGDPVASREELEIANWLTKNGINYEYEHQYPPHLLPTDWRGFYNPDFYLTESDIYIEHFGVGREWQTAPDVDSAGYIEEMKDKREIHHNNKTTLVETYSYEHHEGIWREELERKLNAHGVKPNPISEEKISDMLKQLKREGTVDTFTETLMRFLVQFKGLRIKIEDLQPDGKRSKAFLKLFEAVYHAYQKDLKDRKRIDFSDMIVRAIDYAEKRTYKSPFKYILVDEFQDVSRGLSQLLKALKAQHSKARLFAVGDDWQSINRFSGTDIRLMREFGRSFGGKFAGRQDVHRTIDLGATFRFGDGIAQPAAKFICENEQHRKINTEPVTHESKITIVYTCCLDLQVGKILQGFNESTKTEKLRIFLLYRNKYRDFPKLDDSKIKYPNLRIKAMTVHQSKGLEADHVIILGAKSGKYGFPSEIKDDPVLCMVLPEQEDFNHAEERRLFYVALTRAKRTVTIFADERKPSVFVDELLKNPACKFSTECEHSDESSTPEFDIPF